MTTPQTIQTVIEFILAAVLIWGLFNERRIAIWERRTFRKIKRRFTKWPNRNKKKAPTYKGECNQERV